MRRWFSSMQARRTPGTRLSVLMVAATVSVALTPLSIISTPSAAAAPTLAAKSAPTCAGVPATLVGSRRGEKLIGTRYDDVIVAGGGADKVLARGGNDIICAGGGGDTVKAGGGRDLVLGGGGKDRLFGQAGNDTLRGGGGPDLLKGGSGEDVLDGGGARDVLNGGGARDACRGEKRIGCETTKLPHPDAVILDKPTLQGASAVVTGLAPANGAVRVQGGALPTTVSTDVLGGFTAVVSLTEGQNRLVAASLASGRKDVVKVTRVGSVPAGTVSGKVVRAGTTQPVSGAVVSVDGATATTGSDGTYELAGPASGVAVVQARADGYLAGLTRVPVTDQVATGDVELVELAAGQQVGPEGGTLTGAGWSLQVPAGAVSEPTTIQVTPVPFTGTKDAVWGIPLYDLSPSGLVFDQPVTFTFDSPLPDRANGPVVLTGLDPDSLTERTHSATLTDGRISFGLSSFDGEETRVEPEEQTDDTWIVGPHNKWGGIKTFCTPFVHQIEAKLAYAYLVDGLLPFLALKVSLWNERLWSIYLAGGSSSVMHDVPGEDPDSFIDDENIVGTVNDRLETVVNRAYKGYKDKGAIPRPLPGATSGDTSYALADLDPGETVTLEGSGATRVLGPGQVLLDYVQPFSPPGNAAGGTGSFLLGGTEVLDEREFSGRLRLEHKVDKKGVVRSAALTTEGMGFRVLDAIDLCPGNPGTGLEKNATIPLSRLESTPETGGSTTWAGAVPFEVEMDLPGKRFGTTKSVWGMHKNDLDGDGWPGTQPYVAAGFELDNCPSDANPGQKDKDKDGLGDACDPYNCAGDKTDDNPLCDLAVFTSKWSKISASGSLGAKGSTATARLDPKAPACDAWPNRDNWTPTPCYREVDLYAASTCVYQDKDTEEFHEISCAAMYSENPGWSTPPISEEADTYTGNGQSGAKSCGASGAFNTYVYGGDARDPMAKWIGRGPTALECRFTWEGAKPDAMPGKAFMQIYGSVRGPEGPHDGYGGYTGYVSTWVPVTGKIKKG